ncbi:MAG TPA: hypothetical protein VFR58_09245 [Flavisolibacter sp.]|nr:hypothetical protein [Flavisolibacter sp.]
MKRIGLLLGCLVLWCTVQAQLLDLKELSGLLDMSSNRLETHLQKKGFKKGVFFQNDDEPTLAYIRTGKSLAPVVQCFRMADEKAGKDIMYYTSSKTEYEKLLKEIRDAGFTSYKNSPASNEDQLFQRTNARIETSVKKIDTAVYYAFSFSHKTLPKRKDIVKAEDLLQLDAHEYLAEVFGRENIKTDLFYYTEKETNKCTVLFPNTNREAIFIWNDENNLRDLSFILIGGHLKEGNTEHINPISNNAWSSTQGIYCGMSLLEIEQLNRQPVKIYNWHTESAGYLVPQNKGNIDFEKIGLVFSCLNCQFLEAAEKEVLDSQQALESNQKIYVTTLIIMPDKKRNSEANR